MQSGLAGFHLGQHAARNHRRLDQRLDSLLVEVADGRTAFIKYAGHFCEEDQRLRMACNGARRGHLIGVHVVVLAVGAERDAGDHRNATGIPDRLQPGGIDRADVTDKAEVGSALSLAGEENLSISAGKTHRMHASFGQCGDERLVHQAGEDHESNVASFTIGDAEPVHELAGLAQFLEGAGKRAAAAVDDHDLMTVFGETLDRTHTGLKGLRIFESDAANLEHDLHCSPSLSSNPYITFMFCTACPDAPLTRLSIAEKSVRRRPSFESANPRSQ